MQFKTISRRSLLLVTVAFILIFLFLEPKIAARIIPYESQRLLTQFISSTERQKKINSRDFWRFREFYSPGSYVYNPNGVATPPILVKRIASLPFTPSLSFTSPRLSSVGGHTPIDSLPKQLQLPAPSQEILLSTSTIFLAKEPDNAYLLLFIKPISEIKKANGFLQHESSADDKTGNFWLDVTLITQ